METMRIVLATSNEGKIRELAKPLADFGIEVVGLKAFPDIGTPEENGKTFAQNALAKARYVQKATHCTTMADDSGLEVDALGGRPGVYSARYGDDVALLPGETHDERNIRKLLGEMQGIPQAERTCRFVTCMAVVREDGREMTVEGHWEGELLTAPLGNNGFGYDPIFYDPVIKTSAAMLSLKEKNLVSHRGKALRGLLARLPEFLRLPPRHIFPESR